MDSTLDTLQHINRLIPQNDTTFTQVYIHNHNRNQTHTHTMLA